MLGQKESKLLKELALAHDTLVDIGIAYTDNYTGEFGEFYAIRLLGLTRYARSHKGADAYDSKGKTYQIKAKVMTNPDRSYTIRGLNPTCFDYLLVVHLNTKFELIAIYQFDSNLGMTSLIVSPASTEKSHLNAANLLLSKEERLAISRFGAVYDQIKALKVFESGNLVGNIGELMAAKQLDLTLAPTNQKGYDALDKLGNKYEIKTRRVYDSTRRNFENRRINNLVGKDTDFLVIVVLDHSFECAGMWLLDPQEISNPKSANLKIVNTTKGVKNLVPSKISYLNDRDPFIHKFRSDKIEMTKSVRQKINTAGTPIKKQSKKKYPAYYFVIAVFFIYYCIIKPNTSSELGVLFYALVGLIAYYLYRQANADSQSREGRIKKPTDHPKENEKRLDEIEVPIELEPSRRVKRNYTSFRFNGNNTSKRERRDVHIDCECDSIYHENCNCDT
ncbi:DUF6998 domain-containing protein [Sphingobacterium sp. xlx-130]|uniref:DUF6998 domain-containing protein n=1 Tax=Sphingobacterium sp. xlx-130 TaxID=2654323 RepID=UPI0013D91D5C|nr:hypothetical protein [Sphingobacterium sp. xlx-130]